MAHPADTALAPPLMSGVASGAGATLTVALLAAVLVWPLLGVATHGFVAPPPELVATTLGIAACSTLGAMGLAAALVVSVRGRMAGGGFVRAVFRAGLLLPPFVAPVAVSVLAAVGARAGGLADSAFGRVGVVIVAQAFAFLPLAVALVTRGLGVVSLDAQQAAELLGASRWTIFRRVTLGLAASGVLRAALVVLGLCLSDVATPLLLGANDLMLAASIVTPADSPASWAGGAVALSALTLAIALIARPWRAAAETLDAEAAAPVGLPATPITAAIVTPLAWLITGAALLVWLTPPIASLGTARPGWHVTLAHWRQLGASVDGLSHSVVLGLGAALVGSVLAFMGAAVVARGREAAAVATTWLVRVPAAIPGVVGALGYLMTFGATHHDLAVLVFVVAAWSLPSTCAMATGVLARSDRAREQAAVSLGAGGFTTARRIVLPTLIRPAVWIFCHGFAWGVTGVGTVIAIVAAGRLDLGVMDMLRLANLGSAGPACAWATSLAALGAAATLLAGIVAGRKPISTLLA